MSSWHGAGVSELLLLLELPLSSAWTTFRTRSSGPLAEDAAGEDDEPPDAAELLDGCGLLDEALELGPADAAVLCPCADGADPDEQPPSVNTRAPSEMIVGFTAESLSWSQARGRSITRSMPRLAGVRSRAEPPPGYQRS